jgi:hypothetical protein
MCHREMAISLGPNTISPVAKDGVERRARRIRTDTAGESFFHAAAIISLLVKGMGRMMFDPSHIQVSCHRGETLGREWKGMDRGLCNRPIKVKKPKAGGKRREERTERQGVFKGEKGARKCTRICASCPNSCALEAKHPMESPAKPPTHRPIIFSGNPAKARPAIRVQAFWVPFRGI